MSFHWGLLCQVLVATLRQSGQIRREPFFVLEQSVWLELGATYVLSRPPVPNPSGAVPFGEWLW